ncbi:MAG: hypothetical protein HUK24_03930, partial [Sphaerochaetaceae bacterium]|nr:hypothetical protein [Sphaerochaetaceae bacterium]
DSVNGKLSLSHITVLGNVVYKNPFYPAVLNDDETAIATLLKKIEAKQCTYTIKEAITDALMGRKL